MKIKLPGSSTFTTVSSTTSVPVGSTIDARSGTVSLTFALPNGGTQTGQFYDGEFVLTQSQNGTVIETLTGSSFAGCSPPSNGKRRGARDATAKKKPGTVIRQLWGNAHGNYKTKGRYGSASVSGTIWLTEDRCDGTLIRAIKDNVIVVSFAHPHKKHNVHQGQSFFIPAPGYTASGTVSNTVRRGRRVLRAAAKATVVPFGAGGLTGFRAPSDRVLATRSTPAADSGSSGERGHSGDKRSSTLPRSSASCLPSASISSVALRRASSVGGSGGAWQLSPGAMKTTISPTR